MNAVVYPEPAVVIDTAVTAVDSLAVDGNITAGGSVTAEGKPLASTGKAIAMAMVFGG